MLGGEEKGTIADGRVSIGGSSDGDGEETCKRGRFAAGEAGRVGEGELESKGRLREGGVGWESGISLGGVCQLSDWEWWAGGA